MAQDENKELSGTSADPIEIVDEVDDERSFFGRIPLFQFKGFWIVLFFSLTLVIHWVSTSDLFDTPTEVTISRQKFIDAKDNYLVNTHYWNAKLHQFSRLMQKELEENEQIFFQRLQETPSELFIAFLVQNLKLTPPDLEQITIFPRDGQEFSVIVSKQESGIWPIKIMLSMEIEISYAQKKFSAKVSRLRRGTQDITLGLSWAYFGRELKNLQALDREEKQTILVTTKE